MNDNEIIKALECCIYQQLCAFDDGKCSYFDKSYVGRQLVIQNAYDLIKRQQTEIEELTDKLENLLCYATGGKLSKSTYSLKTMELAVDDNVNEYCREAETEAVKEFIKRFEKKIKDVKFTIGQTWEIKSALKEVVKEMVGEDDGKY